MSRPPVSFPTDEMTLRLLIAACNINPDTGQTHLMDFLDMGTRIKSVTNEATGETYPDMEAALEDADGDGPPIFFVEHEPGYGPFSEHEVIVTLAEEVLALREEIASTQDTSTEVAS